MDAALVLVGQGQMREEMERFVEEHGLKDHVHFIEDWENVYTLMAACDCLIYTTFGFDKKEAILTASALGKPVIATKIQNHPYVIQENKTGYLVPCGFPERIDSAVMRLKAIPTLADEIGQQGRAFVEKHFSLNAMSEAYMNIYQNLLKNI